MAPEGEEQPDTKPVPPKETSSIYDRNPSS
jgi:hypothetical protein